MPEDDYTSEAEGTRLLVAISFHFLPSRIGFLTTVVDSLCSFSVVNITVVIYTNKDKIEETEQVSHILAMNGDKIDISFEFVKDLNHPYDLTWAHRDLINDRFINSDFLHFVYLEDDELFSFENFRYFLSAEKFVKYWAHSLVC